MDIIKKQLLDAFRHYLKLESNLWRLNRLSTFVDLIILSFNKNEKIPNQKYLQEIGNYLIAAHINLKLGTKSLSSLDNIKSFESNDDLLKEAEKIIDFTLTSINKSSFDDKFNFSKELIYLKSIINLNLTNDEVEVEFIETSLSKLIVYHIKNYFY